MVPAHRQCHSLRFTSHGSRTRHELTSVVRFSPRSQAHSKFSIKSTRLHPMTDPIGRTPASWVRRGRGSSRASSSSARSSAIFDDHHLHPHGVSSSHALRPMDSRFSLNEQFAATRRDFEFGYDDSSSIWERATTADEGEGGDQDDTVVLDHHRDHGYSRPIADGSRRRGVPINRTYYELLCLPASTAVPPQEIRRAYHRLFQILRTESQPRHLSPVAERLLGSVQEAFETLIEPYRRVGYDLSIRESLSDVEESDVHEETSSASDGVSYEDELREGYLNLTKGQIASSTDLGLRLDVSPVSGLRRGDGQKMKKRNMNPVDLYLRQSMNLSLPTLGQAVQKTFTSTEDLLNSKLPDAKHLPWEGSLEYAIPTLTVTGGIHGFMDESYRTASLLTSRYQPPGPSLHAQRHLEQLVSSRFLPVLNLKLRHELYFRDVQGRRTTAQPKTVVEQEFGILPEPGVTTRVAHAIDLHDGAPVDVEVCVTKYGRTAPIVGLALHRRLAAGTAFVALDAGDWTLRPAEECRQFSQFSTVTRRFAHTRNPFRNAPTVEVGFTAISYDLGLRRGRGFTRPADRGVRAMDVDIDDDPFGSWTVSVGATADTVAGYVRYGRDLFSMLSLPQSSMFPPGNRSHRHAGIRGEIELSSTQHRDSFLALRALKRVGRFSKFGFEVGVSPSSLHLSLYWSRLGQRINIPFLLATKSSLSTEVVFWAALLPFLGLAAAEIMNRRAANRGIKSRRLGDLSREDMQEYVAKRRVEADELTVILATGAEPRQRMERQAGGLVILSAKYRVKGAPSDEVADVTVAVAALVDSGELVIPSGLRKSRLPGFWDPAPLQTKALFVQYLYQGKEHSVEVLGREELRLP